MTLWKILTGMLYGSNPANLTKLLRGAMILHNWFIDEEFCEEVNLTDASHAERKRAALRKRDALKRLINVLD
jgi:hypothetical protein